MKPHLNLVRAGVGGKAVVFQHGLCGSAGQTAEAFPNDPRFQMLTLECRGHGASEPGPLNAFSIKSFANDVADVVEEQNLGPLIIGGISMGAAISLHLAVRKPHLVKALVLARPAWLIDNKPENMKPNAEIGDLLATHSPQDAKALFLQSETAHQLEKSAPDNLASLTSFFAREPLEVTAALLTSISHDGPGVTEQQVRALKIPTLIIATGQDAIHPLSHADALHEMISHSRMVEITPKGVDKARYVKEFQSTLLEFFEENV
jgi:pimeloyl-ACP methyl ester carboxylesterase